MVQTFSWALRGNDIEVFEGNLEHIPDILYHVTPKDRVKSILANGLVIGSPRATKENVSLGIYFIKDFKLIQEDAMDSFDPLTTVVLEVDVSTFKDKLIPDPEWRSYENKNPMHCEDDIGWYVTFDVDTKFIKVM